MIKKKTIVSKKPAYGLSSKSGFTMVEIIAAAVIISITVAGTFSAYLYARQFSNKFLYKSTATKHAQAIVDYLRYRLPDGYQNNSDLASGQTYTQTGVTDSGLADLLDTDAWDMADKVDSLDAEYEIQDVAFNDQGQEVAFDPSIHGPGRAFKKVIVRVNWQERESA
jgi:prepilin-type N-terminal cleavage/methylation domain-containing protein